MNLRQPIIASALLVMAVIVPAIGRGGRAAEQSSEVRQAVTRDTWVSSVDGEQDGNLGGEERLKTKGIQEYFMVDVDPGLLKGRVIKSAALHLYARSPDKQLRLSVSTLASQWVEGTSRSYRPQKGSSSFRMARQDEAAWTLFGGDLTAVSFGQGNTIWRFSDATPVDPPGVEGWQTVAVEPATLAARVAGISYGFVVMDDVGSEYERQGERFTYKNFPNRFVASRETGPRFAPYFTVVLGKEDKTAPGSPIFSPVASGKETLPAGEAIVSWTAAADAGPAPLIGFDARIAPEGTPFVWERTAEVPRYLIPMANFSGGKPGQPVAMHIRDGVLEAGKNYTLGVRTVDGAGNAGAVGTTTIRAAPKPAPFIIAESSLKSFTDTALLPQLGQAQVTVVDALDKVEAVTGKMIPAHDGKYLQANHIWDAATRSVRLQAGRNEHVAFQVVLMGDARDVRLEASIDKLQIEIARHGYVKAGDNWLGDPLLPMSAGPQPATIPNQKYNSYLVDLYVPHDHAPGPSKGILTLRTGDARLDINIDLAIWDFTLPDVLSFIAEMNSYGLPDGVEEMTAYYRLAHAHRTALNRLPYNWAGRPSPAPGMAPKWDGKQFDWAEYDKRFGPLLDGSAFSDLPRKGVPVDVFYLPLNENWPMEIEKSFTGGYWAEKAFSSQYRTLLVESSRQFAAHFREKKWTSTLFEFFLNGKVNFKKDGWSRASSPWVFDEPVNTQDFWALRWFGQAFHEGVNLDRTQASPLTPQLSPKLVFRGDVSRPQWQRDTLDGVLDVNVVSGSVYRYQRAVLERKTANGEITLMYGSANAIDHSNVQGAAWCLDAWTLGLDGVLPWQTIGTENSWKEADTLSLFYPGAGRLSGLASPVVPSIRLKSFRQGQQLVEYLTLLQKVTGLPRWQIAQVVRDRLKLAGKFAQKSADDAGQIDFDSITPAALWELRAAIGQMLNRAKPAPQRALVDFLPPVRDPKNVRDLGYVTTEKKP